MTVLPGYYKNWSPFIHFVLSIWCLNSLTPADICALSEVIGYLLPIPHALFGPCPVWPMPCLAHAHAHK